MSPLTEPTKLTLAKGQPVPVDLNYSNVSLLLHGNGANGSTAIVDNSPTPKTVTAFGNAQISTAQSKFGGASLAFDGNGDYAIIPNSSDFALSGDFTIECWSYINRLNNSPAIWCVGNAFGIVPNAGLLLYWATTSSNLRVYSAGATLISSSTNVLTAGTWQHLVVARSGTNSNNLTLYVDGVARGQTTSNTLFTGIPANGFMLGGEYANGFVPSLDGYIDELRITKGVARYTTNFTPPTAPFLDF